MGHESAPASLYNASDHRCIFGAGASSLAVAYLLFFPESLLRDLARSRFELSPVPSASRRRGPRFLAMHALTTTT